MDLNKEITLSGLFRRKSKAEQPETSRAPAEKEPRRRAFGRKPKAPANEVEAARTAPALPQIPLMRAFNLLPREEARAATRKGPALGVVLVALAGIVALAGLGTFFLFTSADLREKRETVDDLRIELAGYESSATQPKSNQATLVSEKAARTTAAAGALGGRVAWDRLLRDLSLVLPDDVYIASLTAQSPTASAAATPTSTTAGPATSFAITGATSEQKRVALLLSRLSILPELSSVRLVSSVRADDGDGVVFTINATVKHEGASS